MMPTQQGANPQAAMVKQAAIAAMLRKRKAVPGP